eukprot:gene3568-3836_t
MSKLDPVLSCLPFTVDTWRAETSHKHQFLTHAHKDHLAGIGQHARRIVCTDITRQLVLLKFPFLKDAEAAAAVEFIVLEPYVQHSFEAVGMPGKEFSVHAIPVDHCAGAVAFLFRSSWFGTILHSGDGRFGSQFVQEVQQLLGPHQLLDLVYLDCTHGDVPQVSQLGLNRSSNGSTSQHHAARAYGWFAAAPGHAAYSCPIAKRPVKIRLPC